MHLLESFSLYTGLKINKPELGERVFPCPYDKFIIFVQAGPSNDGTNFGNFSDIIFETSEILKSKNIGIVNITKSINRLPFDNEYIILKSNLKHSHLAYLIKNSELLCSNDSFCAAIAGAYGIKNIHISTKASALSEGPFFKNGNDPFFYEEDLSKINFGNISEKIIKELNVDTGYSKKNILHIGSMYNDFQGQIIEVVPNCSINTEIFQNRILNIKLDFLETIEEKNYAYCFDLLKTNKANIITDKPFNIDIFNSLKTNINSIIYDVTPELNEEFLNKCLSLCKNTKLIFNKESNDQNEILNDRKLKIIDLPLIISVFKKTSLDPEILEKIKSGCKYKSKKVILSERQAYISKAAFFSKRPVLQMKEPQAMEQSTSDILNKINQLEQDDADCILLLE